jgi:hypothetical protein
MRTLIACLAVLFVTGTAAAANLPGPSDNTVFAYSDGDAMWLSTVRGDEAGTANVITMSFPAEVSVLGGSGNYPTGRTVEFALGASQGKLAFDTAGTVEFIIAAGAGCCVGYGKFSGQLAAGSTVIASFEGEDQTWTSYSEKSYTATPEVAEVSLDSDLVWTVTFEGSGAVFMRLGAGDMFSRVVMPLVAPTVEEGEEETNTTTSSTTATKTTSTSTTSTTPTNTTTTTTTSNGTTTSKGDEAASSKDTPGAGLLLGLGAIAVAVVTRRRNP